MIVGATDGSIRLGVAGTMIRKTETTRMTTMAIFRSVLLFILAGLCEIGGGWLIWQSLREQKPAWWGWPVALS